ncbi:MAG TPA: HAD hydrolase-like protein [Lentimicrobium sp.]|nr:HAD hydrolase-like protein [Lentimicrobium sp.]
MALLHLLFDLDGTLTDSKRGIFNAVNYTLDQMNILQDEKPADLSPFIGPPLRDSFRELFNFSEETAEKATRIYREYYGRQRLFEYDIIPGIEGAINNLAETGVSMYVVTSKAEEYAVRIVESLPFGNLFKTVTGCEIDGRRSNKHELIMHTLNKFRLNPSSQIIMIGDRYHDIRGAKAAGISSAAVLYGYGSLEELIQEEPTILIEQPIHLLDLARV